MSRLTIDYLVDHPAMLTSLAEALRSESPSYFGEQSTNSIVETLLTPTLQRDALPLTLVAHDGGRFVGAVALRHDSITARPQLGPWLAALHVVPAERGHGIGAELIRAAENEARRLGIRTLFAGSGRAATLFRRLDWAVVEMIEYHGEPLSILRRELG